MKTRNIILLLMLVLGSTLSMAAQSEVETRKDKKKVWEFGLGATVYQFNRVGFSNFTNLNNDEYIFDLTIKHSLWGGNFYVARELNSHFYLDLQGSVGTTSDDWGNSGRKWLYEAGLGLQWRLGEYFQSKYIDPYLRVGTGYMYKDFDIYYVGSEGLSDEKMSWILNNLKNKDGDDRKSLIPVKAGIGINLWLNDQWGIGLQGDYVLMPYKHVANSLQGTARIIYRLNSK